MEVTLRKKLEGEKSQNYAASLSRLSYMAQYAKNDPERALAILAEAEKIFVDHHSQEYIGVLQSKGIFLMERSQFDESLKAFLEVASINLSLQRRLGDSYENSIRQISNILLSEFFPMLTKLEDSVTLPIIQNLLYEN